jgi:2-oxoglutarate dehydrogenase E1 component
MEFWRDFHGPNAGYVLELYDRYKQDPESVDAATRALFARWSPPVDAVDGGTVPAVTQAIEKVTGAVSLAQAIRGYGHLSAQLDPLGSEPLGDPALALETHGLAEEDLRDMPANLVGGPLGRTAANALEAIQMLREVYTSRIGYDYDHVRIPEEREWLREAAESQRYRPSAEPDYSKALLERLTEVEAFEHFLKRAFPTKYRFSVEGLDMLVPMLDELIVSSAEMGIDTILIGMAHRGRLNVLATLCTNPTSKYWLS